MKGENLIIKDWRNIDISFGLIYPNIHKIGMSSYSIRLLYFLLNSYDNIVCERVFLPDNVKYPSHAFYNPKNQIRSVENRILLDEFDILGFSLQFENDFKNILWILEDSRIPIKNQARESITKEDGSPYPLIIAGGPVATSNPIPFSLFFDLFFIGDSEPNLEPFLKLFETYKDGKIDKKELLKKAQSIEGLFVPSLNNKVIRAVKQDLDQAPIPDYQLLSKSSEKNQIFMSNYFIEINRGCPFKCKFCISSFHNSPFRNRSFNKIINAIDNGIKYSHFDTISMIGSCVSANPKFAEICEYILENGIRFTIPSIRIEHLNAKIIQLFEVGNIKTITLAPETGSEKLRYKLGKKISDEKIYSVLEDLKKSKIRNVKLYFLIGLPEETNENIDDTIDMLKNFENMGFDKDSLRVNINPLIPKLNTPYENKPDFFLDENINKLKLAYQKIENETKKLPSIKLKFQNISRIIKNAKLQALISLGDKKIGLLLTNYYLEGAHFGALRKAEKMADITINDYFQKIRNGLSPWRI